MPGSWDAAAARQSPKEGSKLMRRAAAPDALAAACSAPAAVCISDSAQQASIEEIESLLAIYGQDCCWDAQERMCKVFLPSRDSSPQAVLRALLPDDYPSASGPVLEVDAPYVQSSSSVDDVVAAMESLFSPGEVCLFNCIELLRERLAQWQEAADEAASLSAALAGGTGLGSCSSSGSSGDELGGVEDGDEEELRQLPESSRRHQEQAAPEVEQALIEQMRGLITSGEPHTERRSTFQAHVAPVSSVAQVKAVVAVLLEHNKIRQATHNIMAYRIESPDRPGVFLQDCDDDGEAAAGGRLLHLLQVADARGVVVVVSRWFGGILLGPARFGLINNTARQLLEAAGFLHQVAGKGRAAGGTKKHAAADRSKQR